MKYPVARQLELVLADLWDEALGLVRGMLLGQMLGMALGKTPRFLLGLALVLVLVLTLGLAVGLGKKLELVLRGSRGLRLALNVL